MTLASPSPTDFAVLLPAIAAVTRLSRAKLEALSGDQDLRDCATASSTSSRRLARGALRVQGLQGGKLLCASPSTCTGCDRQNPQCEEGRSFFRKDCVSVRHRDRWTPEADAEGRRLASSSADVKMAVPGFSVGQTRPSDCSPPRLEEEDRRLLANGMAPRWP